MKIIKPSPYDVEQTWQTTCPNCKAVLEYGVEDLGTIKYYNDQRDGDYYYHELKCMKCRTSLTGNEVPRDMLRFLWQSSGRTYS